MISRPRAISTVSNYFVTVHRFLQCDVAQKISVDTHRGLQHKVEQKTVAQRTVTCHATWHGNLVEQCLVPCNVTWPFSVATNHAHLRTMVIFPYKYQSARPLRSGSFTPVSTHPLWSLYTYSCIPLFLSFLLVCV